MLNLTTTDRLTTGSKQGKPFCYLGGRSDSVLPVNQLTLRFMDQDDVLEREYKDQYFVRYLPLIRGCHWMAIFFYSVFGILDCYLLPEKAIYFLVIRIGIVCPLFAVGLVLSYMSWYRRICPFMLMFYVILTASGFTAMTAIVPIMYSYGFYVGVMACLLFGYTFTRLPFLHATAAGWIVIYIYWIFGAGIIKPPETILINQMAYLLGVNFLLMIICYTLERADRHNFYLSHLLEAEKDKVNTINQGLEETVKVRTIDLEAANSHLSKEIEAHKAAQAAKEQLAKQLRQAQKMEAVGTLAGGIAHDFNNILGSIMGFTELAKDDAEQDSLQYSNLEEVMVASKRARDLVRQILAFSRRGEQSMQPVALQDIIKEVRTLLRATLPTSIAIDLQVIEDCHVLADPSQINQVVMNLGINASQAIGNKGIIKIKLNKTTLDQTFCNQHPGTSPGAYAVLSIEDTGSGIAPEILDRIFDPFFTTKPQGKGTGLGLSVVHGIVKNHGGAIKVRSQVNQGTVFDIFLPVLDDKMPVVESPAKLDIPGGREHILYVDDEQALLNFGRQTLSRLGYHVVTRDNALEALELFMAQHEKLDLVITDLTMPHMNGDALAIEVKKVRSEMPIILCSGLDTRVSQHKLEEIGVAAVINKPVLKAELARTVRRVLDAKLNQNPLNPAAGEGKPSAGYQQG